MLDIALYYHVSHDTSMFVVKVVAYPGFEPSTPDKTNIRFSGCAHFLTMPSRSAIICSRPRAARILQANEGFGRVEQHEYSMI